MVPEQTETQDEWLSVADVAAEFAMGPSTVRRWAADGLLPATRIGRRQWRFRRSAVQEFVRGQAAPRPDRGAGSSRTSGLDPLALTSDEDLVEPQ